MTREGLLTFLCAALIAIGAAAAGLVFLWVVAALLFLLAG